MSVNLPSFFTSGTCATILSIKDDEFRATENNDYIVGRNVTVSFTINNAATLTFRDIIVLGKLITKSQNSEQPWATIECRNVIILGKHKASCFRLNGKNLFVGGRYSDMIAAVEERFIESLRHQRECVNQIGLTSVLAV